MTLSKLNVAYSYSWLLPSGDTAQVRDIIESLRQFAIDRGSESVSDVIVLSGNEAHAVRSGAECVIMFTASVPNARSDSGPQSYGLGFSPEKKRLVLGRGCESFVVSRDQRTDGPRSIAGRFSRNHIRWNDYGISNERRR